MAVQRPAVLTKLIRTLARIHPEIGDSRRVAVLAGLDETMIAFDPRSAVNWTEIVSHALRDDKLDALVQTAFENDDELLQDATALLADYRKWAEKHVATPEDVAKIASQPAPKFLELTGTAILSWSAIAIACFIVAGTLARESRHVFLGLPGSHAADLFQDPAGYAGEGWAFLGHLFSLTADYASLNPLGFFAAVALVVAAVILGRRKREMRRRFTAPAVVIPLLLAGAVAKTLWYDAPAAWYANVVLRDPRPEALVVPRVFTAPARARWKSIVCSRVAGDANAATFCGSDDRITYRQNVEGTYLLNAGFTVLLCTIGIFVIRKLLLPSRDRAWNLSRRRKWRAAMAVGIGLLFALLPLPSTYSRTARPTEYPYLCPPSGDCYFRICVEDECHRYTPGDFRFLETGAIPPNSRERSEDILTKALQKAFDTEEVIAPL